MGDVLQQSGEAGPSNGFGEGVANMATLRYETEDGKLFGSLEEAKEHEKRQKRLQAASEQLSDLLYQETDLSRNDSWDVAKFLLSKIAALQTLQAVFEADKPASGQEKG